QKKYQKIEEENSNLKFQVEQLQNINNQFNLIAEENNQLKEHNDQLIAENSELKKNNELLTNQKTTAISLLNVVRDELEELQDKHDNLVEFIVDNLDNRYKRSIRFTNCVARNELIELLD